jgi:hypothetical protein
MALTVRERRAVVVGGALALMFGLTGCPPEPQDPPRSDAPTCTTLADCNAGASCGLLAACVDQRCEAARSLEVPCPAAP